MDAFNSCLGYKPLATSVRPNGWGTQAETDSPRDAHAQQCVACEMGMSPRRLFDTHERPTCALRATRLRRYPGEEAETLLFMAQCVDGVEDGGFEGGDHAEEDADAGGAG